MCVRSKRIVVSFDLSFSAPKSEGPEPSRVPALYALSVWRLGVGALLRGIARRATGKPVQTGRTAHEGDAFMLCPSEI